MSESDTENNDDIGFVAFKEENLETKTKEEKSLVSQVEKKYD